jgi:glycine cleavage system H protein
VKAVSDIYSPVSGEVTAVNEALNQAPEKLNDEPHGAAWLIKMKLTAPGELKSLLSAAQYQEYLEKGA